jgi:hypothetical protein
VTKLTFLSPAQLEPVTRQLAASGVAVTVLPSTDLYLMGRDRDHDHIRGVVRVHDMLHHGVNCSLSTNNVLNPFTPFGDCSLIRMANIYANIAHAGMRDFGDCLDMVTRRSARLLRRDDYGLEAGKSADLVVLDCTTAEEAVSNSPCCRTASSAADELFAQARGDLPAMTAVDDILARDTLGAFCRHTHVALEGAAAGPLAGATCGVKDLYHIAGHRTGFGNPAWFDSHPPARTTAVAVQRLLAAGARMVGRTHTDELAYSLNGENRHYGTPVSVNAPGRIPGGPQQLGRGGYRQPGRFRLGSDTGGSVRIPAALRRHRDARHARRGPARRRDSLRAQFRHRRVARATPTCSRAWAACCLPTMRRRCRHGGADRRRCVPARRTGGGSRCAGARRIEAVLGTANVDLPRTDSMPDERFSRSRPSKSGPRTANGSAACSPVSAPASASASPGRPR